MRNPTLRSIEQKVSRQLAKKPTQKPATRAEQLMSLAKGTAQLNVGIDPQVLDELRKFSEARGETLRDIVELALRRHMKYPVSAKPVPPPAAPLPDGDSA